VLDVDHRGNGRLRSSKYNFLPQQDDPDVPRHIIDRDRLRPGVFLTGQAVRRNGRLQLIKSETVEGLPPPSGAQDGVPEPDRHRSGRPRSPRDHVEGALDPGDRHRGADRAGASAC